MLQKKKNKKKITIRQRQNVLQYFNGQSMALNKRVQILGLPWIFSGKADFVLLLMAQITRKKIKLPKLFSVNYVRAGTSNSLQYLNLVEIKKKQ